MERDVGASLRKCDGDAGAKALRGSCDQRVLALETEEIEDCHGIAPS
jgi:hypothetical protein